MNSHNGNGNVEFTEAFQRTRAAARLCMALVEAGNNDPHTSEKVLWAGVDAIIEECCRDVKDIWKRRYAQEDVFIKGRVNGTAKVNGTK